MVKVNITKQSNYPVKVTDIKKKLAKFFVNNGIVSDAEVSIAIVGEAKMLSIGRTYKKDDKLHNVFSFTPTEVKNFIFPPDNLIHLGEIVVCYPQAVKEANGENKLVDEKVYELIEHSALHLLGIHHEE